jgi:hypothetical protein
MEALSPGQFDEQRLFDPGPPAPTPVRVGSKADSAREFVSRPDVSWHASSSPVLELDWNRQFHAGTIKAASDRAEAYADSETFFHPVSLSGKFHLASEGPRSGYFKTEDGGSYSRVENSHPTRWSDRVINNYSVLSREHPASEGAEDRYRSQALDARDEAIALLDRGYILPYTNSTEDVGSTSFVTASRKNVGFFHDTHKGHVLTGRIVREHGVPAVEEPALPFSREDSDRLDIQSIFHNNVPEVHRRVAAEASKLFDNFIGLHPSSFLSQVPATETDRDRQRRLSSRTRVPNVALGLNTLESKGPGEQATGGRNAR